MVAELGSGHGSRLARRRDDDTKIFSSNDDELVTWKVLDERPSVARERGGSKEVLHVTRVVLQNIVLARVAEKKATANIR